MNSSTLDTKSVSVGQSAPVKRTRLIDINEWITCYLCGGYLIDAMTLIECQTLHSFCKSCIFKHLQSMEQRGMTPVCPTCDEPLNESKPHTSMRQDTKLQDIVYKLVPGLYKREMERRREFYKKIGSQDPKGEVGKDSLFYVPSDKISLSLEYHLNSSPSDANSTTTISDNSKATNNGTNHKRKAEDGNNSNGNNTTIEMSSERRYLLCEAGMPVYLLKKFIVQKYSLDRSYQVHLMYNNHLLTDDLTLMDVIYIYSWCSNDPMRFYYTIEQSNKKMKTSPITIETCERLKEGEATDHLLGHRKEKGENEKELLSPQEEKSIFKSTSIVSPVSTSNCSSDSNMSITSPKSKHHHHHHKKKKEKEPKPTFHAVPTSRGVTIKKDVSPQVSPKSKDQPQGSFLSCSSPPSASAAVSSESSFSKGVPSPPSVPIVASPPISMVMTPSVSTVTTPNAMPIKTTASSKVMSSCVDSKKKASPAMPSKAPSTSAAKVVTNGPIFKESVESRKRALSETVTKSTKVSTNSPGIKSLMFDPKKMRMSPDIPSKAPPASTPKLTNGQIFKEKFAAAEARKAFVSKVTTPTTTKFGSMTAALVRSGPTTTFKPQLPSGHSAIGQSNNKQLVKSSPAVPPTFPIKPSVVKPPPMPTVPTTSAFLRAPVPCSMAAMTKPQDRSSPSSVQQQTKVQDRSSPNIQQKAFSTSSSTPLIKVPSFSSLANKSFGPSTSPNIRTPSPSALNREKMMTTQREKMMSSQRVSSPSQHRVSSPSSQCPRVVSPFTSLTTLGTKSLPNPTSFPIPKLPPPQSLPSPTSSLSALKMVNGIKATPEIPSQKPSHTIQDILYRDTNSQMLNGFKAVLNNNHNHHSLPRVQVSKSPSLHIPIQQIKHPRPSLDQVLNRITKNHSQTAWPPFPVDLSCASGNKPN